MQILTNLSQRDGKNICFTASREHDDLRPDVEDLCEGEVR